MYLFFKEKYTKMNYLRQNAYKSNNQIFQYYGSFILALFYVAIKVLSY